MKSIINRLPKNKLVRGDIPLILLKNSEFTFNFLTECINKVLQNSKFVESLELSDKVTVYKRGRQK